MGSDSAGKGPAEKAEIGGAIFGRTWLRRTIDGDGNALGEDIAVSADEDGDLGELVVLGELGGRVGGVNHNPLDIEVVGLSDGQDGRRAGVVLREGKAVS